LNFKHEIKKKQLNKTSFWYQNCSEKKGQHSKNKRKNYNKIETRKKNKAKKSEFYLKINSISDNY
jgi:hypothetical protein